MKRINLLFGLIFLGMSQLGFGQGVTVVGGTNAPQGAYPFMVGLQDPGTSGVEPFCGAALIHPEWVITAGHCVMNMFGGGVRTSIEVVINPYSLSNPDATHERLLGDAIVPFPGFSLNTLNNDIALIHLKTPSTLTPLKLPGIGDSLIDQAGTMLKVIGWGVSDTANTNFRIDTLQLAEIEVIDRAVCNEPNRYAGSVTDKHLCAGRITGSAKGAASGDSGGPLFWEQGGNMTLVGLVSFGQQQFSTAQYPGVFTLVRKYRDWIDSTMSQHVSLDEQGILNDIDIYQSEDFLNLSMSQPLEPGYSITLWDINGQMLWEEEIEAGQQSQRFSLKGSPKGLKVVQITNGRDMMGRKIVIY